MTADLQQPVSFLLTRSGLRQRKQSGGTTTYFVWDEQNLLLEQE